MPPSFFWSIERLFLKFLARATDLKAKVGTTVSTKFRRLTLIALALPALWIVGCSSSPSEGDAPKSEDSAAVPDSAAATTDTVPTADVPPPAPEAVPPAAPADAQASTETQKTDGLQMEAPPAPAAPTDLASAPAPVVDPAATTASAEATPPAPESAPVENFSVPAEKPKKAKHKTHHAKAKSSKPKKDLFGAPSNDLAMGGMNDVAPPSPAEMTPPPPPPAAVPPPPPPVAQAVVPPPPPPPPPAPAPKSEPIADNFGDKSPHSSTKDVMSGPEPWFQNKMILGGIAFVVLAGALVYMRISKGRD